MTIELCDLVSRLGRRPTAEGGETSGRSPPVPSTHRGGDRDRSLIQPYAARFVAFVCRATRWRCYPARPPSSVVASLGEDVEELNYH